MHTIPVLMFAVITQAAGIIKQTALDQGETDHTSLSIDLDLQSPASYGHDLYTRKSSMSTAN